MSVTVTGAYRFALDPTPAQERDLLRHAGAARVAFNWALARVKAVMDQRAAERTYGMSEEDLTPSIGWNLPALRRAWNAAKDDVAPWWRECSKEAYNTGLDALARGLKGWSGSRTGKRAGRPMGFVEVQVPPARYAEPAVDHRRHSSSNRPSPCHAAPPRHHQDARVDPQARSPR